MKILILLTVFLFTNLFANYAYNNSNTKKIDMHGGNSDSLTNHKSSFSNMNSNNLSNLGIKKKEERTLPNAKKPKKFRIDRETPTEKDEEKNLGELEDLGL